MMVTTVIRCLAILGLVVFEAVIVIKAIFNMGIFSEIGNNDCADDFTNNFFIALDGKISTYAVLWQMGIMVILLLILVLEILYTVFIRYGLFKRLKAVENAEEAMINGYGVAPSINGSYYAPPSTGGVNPVGPQ